MKEWFGKYILGLPPLASENGQDVDNLVIYVHWLMIALFIGWIIYFCYTVNRFRKSRNPQADYVGVRSHTSSLGVELAIVGIEAFLLIVIAVPLWAKAVDKFPAAKDSTVIQIVAQQYAWNARYAGPDGIFGAQDMKFVKSDNIFGVDPTDANAKDDIQVLNDIHVPINKPVIIYLTSKDVIHSLKIIAMRVCQDAIPGMRITVWFKPTVIGRYQINCAQLCGPGHAAMTGGFITVDSPEDYAKWIKAKSGKVDSFE